MGEIKFFSIKEIVTTWPSVDYFIVEDDEISAMWKKLLSRKRKDGSYRKTYKSIKIHGLVGVLTTTMRNGKYIHLDGHHRLAAMQSLGFIEIPYLVDDKELWSKVGNDNRIGTSFHEDIITRAPTRS